MEPAGAVPMIFGEFSLAGEGGWVDCRLGAPGAAVSTAKERVAAAPVLVAASVPRTRKV